MRAIAITVLAALLMPGLVKARAEDFAIINARVFTGGTPAVLDNATVTVSHGRIEMVGPDVSPPAGLRTIDAAGAWLTPGLMNAATQLGLVEMGTASATDDTSVDTGDLGADFDISYAINPNSTLIPLARADGLTAAAVLPGGSADPPFTGLPAILQFSPSGNMVIRPRSAVAAVISGDSASAAGGSRAAQWIRLRRSLDEAGNRKRRHKPDEGEDSYYAHRYLRQVLEGEIPLVLSTSRESDIRQAVALARDYDIRLVLVDAAESWRVADELAALDIGVIINPILNLPESFDMIGARNTLARDLAEAGVTFGFKSFSIHVSYNAGIGVREAAGTAVAHGLPWTEAMRGLTRYPAEIWGIGDSYGQIAPGFHADLVLWDGDPLEPSSNAVQVWMNGVEADLVTRQDLLAARYVRRHFDSTPVPAAEE